MNRARRRTDLFVERQDYQQFIDLLQETAERIEDLKTGLNRLKTTS